MSEAIQWVGGRAGVRSSALDVRHWAKIRAKKKTMDASVDPETSYDRL